MGPLLHGFPSEYTAGSPYLWASHLQIQSTVDPKQCFSSLFGNPNVEGGLLASFYAILQGTPAPAVFSALRESWANPPQIPRDDCIWKHFDYRFLQWLPSMGASSKTLLVITSSLRL